MSLEYALEHIVTNTSAIPREAIKPIPSVLAAGMKIKGDFPSSLAAVEGMRGLLHSAKSTVGAVTEKMFDDPIMALRVAAISNHSYYSRGRTIQSVSGAINHLGLMNILEVVSEVAPAKGYNAIFLGRACASAALQEALLAAIISRRVIAVRGKGARKGIQEPEEIAFLVSVIAALPTVALAYYKPNVYSGLTLDTLADPKNSFRKRAQRLFGKPLGDLAIDLSKDLGVPEALSTLATSAEVAPWNRRTRTAAVDGAATQAAVYLGARLASEMYSYSGANTFYQQLHELAEKTALGDLALTQIVGESIKELHDRCVGIGLKAFRLPDFAIDWAQKEVAVSDEGETVPLQWPSLSERINPFIYELKACLRTVPKEGEFHRLPQAIYCTLRALVQGLSFDRSCFFSVDRLSQTLTPRLLFGQRTDAFAKLNRSGNSLDSEAMPDVQAIDARRAIFHGDPIFDGYWPFVAFPVIWCDQVVGVFYADMREGPNPSPLETAEQVAIVALSEAWHDVPINFF